MNVRSQLLICLFSLFLSVPLFAQNLFTEKLDICQAAKFCMDCGSPKATCDLFTIDYICDRINRKYTFGNGTGSITFQVLVDSSGFSCVLSHTDATHSRLTSDLIRFLDGCMWSPAIQNSKPVAASVNVIFTIIGGKIYGHMQRMDLAELESPGKPTIYNQQYEYRNNTLNKYDFTVLTKYNSPLPDNIGQACVVDKYDILWYATAHGLTRFDGKSFNAVNEFNSPFSGTTSVQTMAVDKSDNKWMFANNAIYMNDNNGWKVFDSAHIAISQAYHIITNPSGEIFFPNKKGLLIFRNDKMRLIDKQTILDLPSNDVYYAYFDKSERLWIGTFGGSIMIDKKKKVTVFNRTNTPLKNACISGITEDEHGNIYFSLYAYKKPAGDNEEEGIAVMTADGHWSHYNDKNSGMPVNHVNSLLYDKFEHVLWLCTQQAGLVRFDLKDGWENYHNANSAMPGYEVSQLAQDSKGVIYAATANGLVKITKK